MSVQAPSIDSLISSRRDLPLYVNALLGASAAAQLPCKIPFVAASHDRTAPKSQQFVLRDPPRSPTPSMLLIYVPPSGESYENYLEPLLASDNTSTALGELLQ